MTERVLKRAVPAGAKVLSVDGVPTSALAAPKPATKAPAKVTSVQPSVSAIGMHALRALVGAPNVSAEQEEADARKATGRLRARAAAEQAAKGLTDQPAAAAPTVLHRPSHGPQVTEYTPTGQQIAPAQPSDQEKVYGWIWTAYNAQGRQLSVTLLPGEIARDLGLSVDAVRSHIAALERLGRIRRDGGSPGLSRYAPVVPGGAR